MGEQRTTYRGNPPRPWLRLPFRDPDGSVLELDLVADTGCPLGIVLRLDLFRQLRFGENSSLDTNFGPMIGGWLRLYLPAWGFVELTRGYGSDAAGAAVANDHPDFVGLVGLPLLRLGQYGGDATDFWFRYPPT